MRGPPLLPLVLLLCACVSTALQIGAAAGLRNGPVRHGSVRCAAPAAAPTKTKITHKTSGGDGGGGGGASLEIAKPKRKAHVEDVPLWKVILLGDVDYEPDPVCTVLQGVIPEISNERQAKERYEEAQLTGKSLLVTVPKEHGELYVEQLARADPEMIVFATIEEE